MLTALLYDLYKGYITKIIRTNQNRWGGGEEGSETFHFHKYFPFFIKVRQLLHISINRIMWEMGKRTI